jgi:hypothetical protein
MRMHVHGLGRVSLEEARHPVQNLPCCTDCRVKRCAVWALGRVQRGLLHGLHEVSAVETDEHWNRASTGVVSDPRRTRTGGTMRAEHHCALERAEPVVQVHVDPAERHPLRTDGGVEHEDLLVLRRRDYARQRDHTRDHIARALEDAGVGGELRAARVVLGGLVERVFTVHQRGVANGGRPPCSGTLSMLSSKKAGRARDAVTHVPYVQVVKSPKEPAASLDGYPWQVPALRIEDCAKE